MVRDSVPGAEQQIKGRADASVQTVCAEPVGAEDTSPPGKSVSALLMGAGPSWSAKERFSRSRDEGTRPSSTTVGVLAKAVPGKPSF